MNIRIILAGFLVLLVQYCNSQEVVFTGTVTGGSTHDILPGAHVLVNDSTLLFTSEKGLFFLNKLGSYNLQISYVGFVTKRYQLELNGQSFDQGFQLDVAQLDEAVVAAEKGSFGYRYSPSVDATTLYTAKKTEIIIPNSVPANLATNNARQAFAQIAGLNIWESDGAGLQLSIGGRGLNPNRTSNFNTRQNGYDISADPLGYPESYYTPPLQAVDKIVIVRGAAALQFGPQFGGMLNFKLQEAPEKKTLALRTEQTIGSYGLLSTFNQIGGRINKVAYHVYSQFKKGDGWRANSEFDARNIFGKVDYHVNTKLTLSGEFTHMHYLAHQPGGLTDTQFSRDPTQSLRSRNWFKVDWNLAAVKAKWEINTSNLIETQVYGLSASREALGFLGLITRVDPLEERDLIRGEFNNLGTETKWRNTHTILGLPQTLITGVRYFKGTTHAVQGMADSGSGPSFSFIDADFFPRSDYEFENENIAGFAEYVMRLTPSISFVPGFRYEMLNTSSEGSYVEIVKDGAGNVLPTYPRTYSESSSNPRDFLLMGAGISWKPRSNFELYGNISQNYRGINFSDIRIQNPKQVVDPNIHDEKGYSMDLGVRLMSGKTFFLDLSFFQLTYQDKIGNRLDTVTLNENIGPQTVQVRSNLGNAQIRGIESVCEVNWSELFGLSANSIQWHSFLNTSLISAFYADNAESVIAGKRVEFVPVVNLKTGIRANWKFIDISWQYTFVSEQYTDATNAGFQSDPNAIVGSIPAYWVQDISAKFTHKQWMLQCGVNNMLDHSYFTRRAAAYPGPGIIPAEPRSIYLTLGWSIWE